MSEAHGTGGQQEERQTAVLGQQDHRAGTEPLHGQAGGHGPRRTERANQPGGRSHLHSLARHRPKTRRRPRPEQLRPGIRLMLTAFGDIPALVIGRRDDVLAWNRTAHALLAGHLPYDAPERPRQRPHVVRLVFLDPHTRELYADWRSKARDTVADLRVTAARFPDDPELAELIGELTLHSTEFASLWAARPVHTCTTPTRVFRHPLVGPMTLHNELMELSHDPGRRIAVFTTDTDSPSAAALRLLADLGVVPPSGGRGAEVSQGGRRSV
ncbi:MmyB family transcriptional regulator [Streptomyces asiaticus]|uniref:MmyB family transcriptional regulator n=1 Tax=Streptomyces asiaticus TaxID=114695 RepID=UPI0037FDDA86